MQRAMKGGIGTASVRVGGVTVGALVACNALGDVIDPNTGALIAGARHAGGESKVLNTGQSSDKYLCDTRRSLLAGAAPLPILAGTNTTIGVIATDAITWRIGQLLASRSHFDAHQVLYR
jgi:L-aminopeptidase/D-esterase-like protein